LLLEVEECRVLAPGDHLPGEGGLAALAGTEDRRNGVAAKSGRDRVD
jgi:hypothetical protein